MRKIGIFILFFLLFLLRIRFLPKLDLKDGQLVKVTGSLSEEPQIYNNRQKINLGQFEIWTDRYPEYHYGDEIEVVGKAKVKSAKFSPPLAGSRLMVGKVQSYLLTEAEIKLSDLNNLNNIVPDIKRIAIELRRQLKSNFIQYFPSPLDGLAAGIVLGDKSLIPMDFWQKLQQTGTLHIMVASGMNIAMFSNGLLKFFLIFFKRRLAVVFVIGVIWFYCLIAGMQAPIVRAGIMSSLIYLSQLTGREAEGGRVLFITAGLMLLINPLLLWDVGFQLSFLATAGLVFVAPRIKSIKSTKRRIFETILRNENFSSSVASQIATLPILIGSFGQVNLLSPLINLVILWTIPNILQIGIMIGLLGMVWIKLGEIASYLIFPLLFYLEQTINLFAKITLFQVQVPRIGWWWGIVYYVILVWLVRRKDSRGLRAD